VNRASKRRDLPGDGRGLLRAALAALMVLTVLVPNDSLEVQDGKGLVLVLLWLLFALAWCIHRRRDQAPVRWGPVEIAVTLLVLLHTASCLWMASEGNARATQNTMWQWIAFGLAFLIIRQLVDCSRTARALCAVMLALAVSLCLEAVYESFYLVPQRYHRYFDNDETVRQEMLQQAGLVAPMGTPLRYHFESRLQSTEPGTTFALTNSLAGFLAPWLIIAIGMTVLCYQAGEKGKTLAGSRRDRLLGISPELLFCILLGFCLLLTKSRSGWVSAGVGMIVILVGQGGRGRHRITSWILASFLLLGAGLGVLAFLVKRLDWLVFTQTLDSFSFRLQYWFASLRMIADYPLLGCGPGNFAEYYMQFKLPGASETVADPHNWILEIWATAGTLSLLATVAVVWSVGRSMMHPLVETAGKTSRGVERSIYAGALVGGLLAFPYSMLVDSPMGSTRVIALGLPVMVLVMARLHDWVKKGQFPAWLPLAALLCWLVNLLAAGGIGTPGVAQGGWLLLAMLLVHGTGGSNRPLPARGRAIVMLLLLGVTASFLVTAYWPVMSSRTLLQEAHQAVLRRDEDRMQELLQEACDADPSWPRPAMELVIIHHRNWGQDRDGSRGGFVEAADDLLQRDPRSATMHAFLASCYLVAHQQHGQGEDLDRARELFQRASELHPSDARLAGQAAWTCWLSGDPRAAGEYAREADRLDQRNSSIELQLDKRRLIELPFPDWRAKTPSSDGLFFQNMNQLVAFLRNQPSRDDASQ